MHQRSGRPAITIDELGEFGLIDRISARLPQVADSVVLGPGDDAAVLPAPGGRVVATTDLLIEGRHFRRDWSPAYDVGRKAAAASLADIAALGAAPTALLVGFAAPGELPIEWAEALADGLGDECRLAGASVAGGDVSRSEAVMLAVTALGDLQGRVPVTRAGAGPGDVVAVAGRLGWAAAGQALLAHGYRSPGALIRAHRRPEPPYAAGVAAAELSASAMIDVSDGLLADLGHIAAASGVGIEIDPAACAVPAPLAEAADMLGADPLGWVLAGGDDHALAATFPPRSGPGEGWLAVGRVTGGEGIAVGGRPYEETGWTHFG